MSANGRPAFLDAHAHLWELGRGEYSLGWLDAPDDGLLGPLGSIRFPCWDADHFRVDIEAAGVIGAIVVPASDAGDGVAEAAWLQAEHDRSGIPDAIVGRPDMRADDVDRKLDDLIAAAPSLRAVRDMTLTGSLADPTVAKSLAAVSERGLIWDLHCFWEDMPIASRIAGDFPDLPIVLGHAGFPVARDAEYLSNWKSGIRELARADNVSCKISGLGMADHHWDIESWRPWVLHCIDAFGVDRCMFGSNWPVDRLYASYETVVAAFDAIVADFSPSEREALFNRTAARTYRLDHDPKGAA